MEKGSKETSLLKEPQSHGVLWLQSALGQLPVCKLTVFIDYRVGEIQLGVEKLGSTPRNHKSQADMASTVI